MEIRFAKPQDVPGIIKLLQQVGRVHHEGRPDLFRATAQKYGPSQVLEMIDKPDAPIFVAVEGNKVLGYGFCMMEQYRQNTVMNDRVTLYIMTCAYWKNAVVSTLVQRFIMLFWNTQNSAAAIM